MLKFSDNWEQISLGLYARKHGNSLEVRGLTEYSDQLELFGDTIDLCDLTESAYVSFKKKNHKSPESEMAENLCKAEFIRDMAAYKDHILSGDLEKISAYLEDNGMSLPLTAKRTEISNSWTKLMNVSEDAVYVRRSAKADYEVVLLIEFKDWKEPFHVSYYTSSHVTEAYYVKINLEFIYDNLRFPTTDLEVIGYEASTHGSSGMDRNHPSVESLAEAHKIMQDVYGITNF